MKRKKYKVFGHTTVIVATEVFAENEDDAKEVALNQRDSLTAFCGNGGLDKLVGVDGEEESVSADEEIEYDDVEYIGLFDEDDEEDDEEDT